MRIREATPDDNGELIAFCLPQGTQSGKLQRIPMGPLVPPVMTFNLDQVLKGVRGRVNGPYPANIVGDPHRFRDLLFCSSRAHCRLG